MDPAGAPRKNRAVLIRVPANGDDDVKRPVAQGCQRLAGLARDVHAGLSHDFDRARILPVGHQAGGTGVQTLAPQGPGPTFGHLASAAVAGAEKKHPQFSGHGIASKVPEPAAQPVQGTPLDAVAGGRAADSAADESGVPQDLQVLGHRGLRQPDFQDQVAANAFS
jgi:hypothetical protein